MFFSPEHATDQLGHIAAGRAKTGKTIDGFEVVPTVPVVVGDDVAMCAEPVRWYAALYLGGMGSREQNFYNRLAIRMGFADAAREVQDLYLGKRQRDAAAAVPVEFIDRTSLLGPIERIADGLRAYADAGVTTLSVSPFAGGPDDGIATLRTVAEALDRAGVGRVTGWSCGRRSSWASSRASPSSSPSPRPVTSPSPRSCWGSRSTTSR